jgi:hypothetical protein
MEKTLVAGGVKACCKVAENLDLLPEESGDGLVVKRCRVCGCRHRRLTLEPGVFGIKGLPIGKAGAEG